MWAQLRVRTRLLRVQPGRSASAPFRVVGLCGLRRALKARCSLAAVGRVLRAARWRCGRTWVRWRAARGAAAARKRRTGDSCSCAPPGAAVKALRRGACARGRCVGARVVAQPASHLLTVPPLLPRRGPWSPAARVGTGRTAASTSGERCVAPAAWTEAQHAGQEGVGPFPEELRRSPPSLAGPAAWRSPHRTAAPPARPGRPRRCRGRSVWGVAHGCVQHP